MRYVKWLLAVLAISLVHYTVAPAAYADGEQGTAQEARDYGQREAGAQDLENFEGGDGGIVVAIVLIAALAVLIYYLVDHHDYHDHHMGKVWQRVGPLEQPA